MSVDILEQKKPIVHSASTWNTNPWHLSLLIFVGGIVGIPLTFLILGSLSKSSLPTEISLQGLSIKNYVDVWTDPETWKLFVNTAIYVLGATAFGLGIATTLACLTERTNFAGKIWIYGGVPLTLAVPGMLQAMAYVLLLSPRIGLINRELHLIGAPSINIYSLGGMIFVEGLRLVPTAFLMLAPLFRSMDPALEEAAVMAGAGTASMLIRITAKLMAPGLAAVGIYQLLSALEVFEVPGVLGLPANIFVFSTKIYSLGEASSVAPAYGKANALAMIYVVIAVATIGSYSKIISRRERFATLGGKAYRPRLIALGGWRYVAGLFVATYLMLSVILPFFVFMYVSVLPFIQIPTFATLRFVTWKNYATALSDPSLATALEKTALLVALTTMGTLAISFSVAMVVVRTSFWGRRALDQLSFIPHAIPGIVLGLSFLWFFLFLGKFGIDVFGSIWSIAFAMTVSFTAYGTRTMIAAVMQIQKDLEHAASVCGAPTWRIVSRILIPLLRPAILSVGLWVALNAIRSAAIPLMLYEGEDNRVLSVLIWNMWDQGAIQEVGAIGVLMISILVGLACTLYFVDRRSSS
jgi:iron(III) transport system permease protein